MAEKEKKLKRIPMFKQQNFNVVQNKNFHYHIAIDKDDNIARFIKGGYGFASSDELNDAYKPSQNAATEGKEAARVSLGSSGFGYLMKIPMKYWKQDQIDKRDDRIASRKQSHNTIQGLPDNLHTGSVTSDSF